MPSTARQLRQPLTIEAIERVPYFADVYTLIAFYFLGSIVSCYIYSISLVYNLTLS